jgi:hypothetical protein
VLASEPGLAGWEETRTGFIRQISLRSGQPPENAERHIPALPATLLDRARWLNDLRLEGPIAGMMSADQDIVGVIRLLLADIERQEFCPAPNPLFKQIIELAVARPEILVVVLFRIRWSPALFADLLLYPATAARRRRGRPVHPATPRPHRLISGQMTSYAVTQRRCRPIPRYTVTPRSENSAGLEAVPGAARPERGLAPSGHCVLQLQEQRLRERFGSRPSRLILLEIFPSGPTQGWRSAGPS